MSSFNRRSLRSAAPTPYAIDHTEAQGGECSQPARSSVPRRSQLQSIGLPRPSAEKTDHRHRLLCQRRERQRRYAAQSRNELPPLHASPLQGPCLSWSSLSLHPRNVTRAFDKYGKHAGRKSAHSPRHEAYHLGMPVPPNRPYHRWSCTIWLSYDGIVGHINPFTADLDAIVPVV